MKRMSVFILMIFIVSECFSQDWNSARISVLNGGSIPLTFNSIEKLKKGIEILSGTKFGISLGSIVGHDLTGFVLNFRSFNNQPNLKGDFYTLPLNRIRVRAENVIGLGSGLTFGYRDLASDWTPLFTYEDLIPPWDDLSWTTHQLNISYECGKPESDGGNGALLGEAPDYYTVEIEFELVPTGPGF